MMPPAPLKIITRPVPPIRRTSITFRTLHPPRRTVCAGVRPAFTLDGLVTITVALITACPELKEARP
ncbi:hypothetical protein [Stappia indica]|uniref:hypothetical protein n=1 Tax=Stappia indica TaxID=538381 RepID=UPI001CD2CF96|nr:hypothetical protein [Stappia indica]MCA1298017.1 hypothetical protein [Stappia indica]